MASTSLFLMMRQEHAFFIFKGLMIAREKIGKEKEEEKDYLNNKQIVHL